VPQKSVFAKPQLSFPVTQPQVTPWAAQNWDVLSGAQPQIFGQ
jgi:hypothetical protein